MKMIVFLLMLSVSAGADDTYRYRFWVKDAGLLKEASDKNEWMQKFYDDVLYQGLVSRLAPVIFSMGEENGSTWKGRLIDMLFETVLKGRPVSLSYFSGGNLASPMGLTVYSLGDTETAVLKTLVKMFGEESTTADVTRLSYRNNTFGISFHQNCLSISREQQVVRMLAKEDCTKFAPKSDAEASLNLNELFSSFSPLLKNFVGVGDNVSLSFKWDPGSKAFVPSETNVPLKTKNIFRKSKTPEALLRALPSSAGIWGLATVADMRPLNSENLKKYFLSKGNLKGSEGVPVIFAYLGMDDSKSMTVLLLPHTNSGEKSAAELAELFNENGQYEVLFRYVCKDILAFSPSAAALSEMENACAKKHPGFMEYAENYTEVMEVAQSGAVFVHPGVLSSSALETGSSNEVKATDEYKQSYQLLTELPHFFWAGAAGDKSLVLKGVKP